MQRPIRSAVEKRGRERQVSAVLNTSIVGIMSQDERADERWKRWTPAARLPWSSPTCSNSKERKTGAGGRWKRRVRHSGRRPIVGGKPEECSAVADDWMGKGDGRCVACLPKAEWKDGRDL